MYYRYEAPKRRSAELSDHDFRSSLKISVLFQQFSFQNWFIKNKDYYTHGTIREQKTLEDSRIDLPEHLIQACLIS
jgi:hypothetical protein